MLKVICGIYRPYRGPVQVNGTIALMIELGAGFDSELTARKNIYLNGCVLGYDSLFINELQSRGTTLILVSHDISQVLKTCRHAAWINKGTLMMVGDAKDVCKVYMENKDL